MNTAFGTAAVHVGERWRKAVDSADRQVTCTVTSVSPDGDIRLQDARGRNRTIQVGNLLARWVKIDG